MGTKMLGKITKVKNNQTYKTVSPKRTKKLARGNKHKASETVKLSEKRKTTHDSQQGHLDYSRYDSKGPNASEVPSDLSPANLRDVMIKYYGTNI